MELHCAACEAIDRPAPRPDAGADVLHGADAHPRPRGEGARPGAWARRGVRAQCAGVRACNALCRCQVACRAARPSCVLLAELHPRRVAAQCTQPPCSGGRARLTGRPACARATSGCRSTTGPRCACSAAWASRSTHARGSGCLRRAPAGPAAHEQGGGALGLGCIQRTRTPVVVPKEIAGVQRCCFAATPAQCSVAGMMS